MYKRQSLPRFYAATKSFLRTPDQGADTIVWLATSTEAAVPSGAFYFDREKRRTHLPAAGTQTRDGDAERLWTFVHDTLRSLKIVDFEEF